MAVDLAKYVVSLEAETSRYTQQLESANRKLEGFETRNRSALLKMGSDFRTSFNSIQRVLAGFGIVLSARALGNWIESAIKVEKLTQSQAIAIGNASKAMTQLNTEFENLARTAATALAPALEKAAKFWKEFFFPSSSQFGSGADALRDQVDAQIAQVQQLQTLLATQTGFDANANWFQRFVFGEHSGNIAATTAQLSAARIELERLRSALLQAQGTQTALSNRGDFFGGSGPDPSQLAFQQKLAEEQRRAAEAGQDLSPMLRAYIENLERAEKITESMRTDVERQTEAWQEAKNLFDAGLLSAETLRRIDEEQLGFFNLNEIHAKLKAPLKKMETDAEKTAQSIGMSFQNAFADWILGVDRSFSDLLKRMAVQMATSAIFKGLAGLFAPSSFFANFFGGFRAEGGPVSAGRAYVVGENGPELFMPNHSGMIAAGGGGGVTIVNNIDARGADPSVAARLPQILAENNQRLKAEIRHERNRGR